MLVSFMLSYSLKTQNLNFINAGVDIFFGIIWRTDVKRTKVYGKKDEKLARDAGISFSIKQIVGLPMDEFNDLLSRHDLTEEQLNLCRDIRYQINVCTLLYCTALYYTILHCSALYCTVLHCTDLYCTVRHCIALFGTVLNITGLYCTLLDCPGLYFTLLHCISLYCTVLHCTSLYCTVG